MFTTAVPIWVSLLFLIAIPIPIILIANLARESLAAKAGKTIFYAVLGFYFCYFAYVTIACFKGLFNVVSLPPRILVLSTIPLLLFLLVIVFNTAFYKKLLSTIRMEDLIRLHRFRWIGVFFLILAYYKALPFAFALIAGLGDIITATLSIWVAKEVQQKKHANTLVLIWNTFGCIDILITAFLASYLTKVSIASGSQGVEALGQFPFCYIPAFAPPTILFLHLSIYRKWWLNRKTIS
jgi:hypothetical protein